MNPHLVLCVLFSPVRAAEPVDEQQDDEAQDEDRDDDYEHQQCHVQTCLEFDNVSDKLKISQFNF